MSSPWWEYTEWKEGRRTVADARYKAGNLMHTFGDHDMRHDRYSDEFEEIGWMVWRLAKEVMELRDELSALKSPTQ